MPRNKVSDPITDQEIAFIDPQPSPAPEQEEDSPGVPEPKLAPVPVGAPPLDPGPSQSTFANRFSPSEAPPPASYVPGITYVPDLRAPFSIKKNPFALPR